MDGFLNFFFHQDLGLEHSPLQQPLRDFHLVVLVPKQKQLQPQVFHLEHLLPLQHQDFPLVVLQPPVPQQGSHLVEHLLQLLQQDSHSEVQILAHQHFQEVQLFQVLEQVLEEQVLQTLHLVLVGPNRQISFKPSSHSKLHPTWRTLHQL